MLTVFLWLGLPRCKPLLLGQWVLDATAEEDCQFYYPERRDSWEVSESYHCQRSVDLDFIKLELPFRKQLWARPVGL